METRTFTQEKTVHDYLNEIKCISHITLKSILNTYLTQMIRKMEDKEDTSTLKTIRMPYIKIPQAYLALTKEIIHFLSPEKFSLDLACFTSPEISDDSKIVSDSPGNIIMGSRIKKLHVTLANAGLFGNSKSIYIIEELQFLNMVILQTPSITSLDLSNCPLGCMPSPHLKQFFSNLSSSEIIFLDLRNTHLNNLLIGDWNYFCEYLKQSKIKTVNVSGNHLNSQQLEQLEKILATKNSLRQIAACSVAKHFHLFESMDLNGFLPQECLDLIEKAKPRL